MEAEHAMSLSLNLDSAPARRLRVRIRGSIQGVGFRPFIVRLARENGLSGWVLNDGDGVLVEIEGAQTGAFLDGLRPGAPRLARIAQAEVSEISRTGVAGFEVRQSAGGDIQTVS